MNRIIKKTGAFKSFDDTRIYYEVRGHGEPLIFVYGIGCLFNHWTYQTKFFSKKYQVILVDYRAHNQSDVPVNYRNLNIRSIARDLHELLKHLNIEKAHFIAHSYGAQVLTQAYQLNPNDFKSITFINGFVKNPLQDMFGSRLPEKAFTTLKRSFDLLPETTSHLWKMIINNPLSGTLSALAGGFNLSLTSYKDIEIYLKSISEMDLKAFLRLFDDMMNFNGEPLLEAIEVPCLIISGQKDGITPRQHQEDIHHKLPHSQISFMPYGSHCTQLDLPEYVNLRLEKFFKEVQASD